MKNLKKSFVEFKLLIRSVPSAILSVFVLAVFAMNLLANKSINISVDWLALDCGIIVSWVAFLCMDVLTRHFGPKAATQLSVFAIVVNLLACVLMYVASVIGGTWGQYYELGELPIINDALNATFGGTWYVILGSAIAFVASAAINNFTNWGIGKTFKQKSNGFGAYAVVTYVSTAIAQFADNLIFALLVSHFFFGWSITQCLMCAATGMVAELLCEVVFSPIGYRLCKAWKEQGVGKEYLDCIEAQNTLAK